MPNSRDRFEDPEANARGLILAADNILSILDQSGTFDFRDPVNMLALQLLGPVLGRAMGQTDTELANSMENLIDMARAMDVQKITLLIQQGVRKI